MFTYVLNDATVMFPYRATEEINVLRGTTDIVDGLGDRLHKVGRSHMTVRWPDFYKLCGRERLKQPFLDKVKKEALNGHH